MVVRNELDSFRLYNNSATLDGFIDLTEKGVNGGGTMVTEGTIVEETRNGPNLSGKGIEGGTPHKLGAGDFFMVPEGIAHWWSQIDPGGMNVMSIHFPRVR